MIPRTVRGAGMALALAGAVDRGRSDAADLARGRRAPARATVTVDADRMALERVTATVDESRRRARLRAIVEMSAWCAMEDDE